MDDAFRGNGPWKIKLAKPDKIIKQLGKSQQGEYDKFKNAIYHGRVDPSEAARNMDNPYPKMLQSVSKAGRDAQGNATNKVNMWEVRIGGKDRVTYLVDDTDRLVTILEVGGHT